MGECDPLPLPLGDVGLEGGYKGLSPRRVRGSRAKAELWVGKGLTRRSARLVSSGRASSRSLRRARNSPGTGSGSSDSIGTSPLIERPSELQGEERIATRHLMDAGEDRPGKNNARAD